MNRRQALHNILHLLIAVATVDVASQNCLGLDIGSVLNNNYARWEWGSDYLPEGQTSIQLTVHVFSNDLDYIAPYWPFIEAPSQYAGREWLDSTLIAVNNQPVSQVEPYYAMPPGEYRFTWEVTPKPGYSWPTQTFSLYAGAYGTSGPNSPEGGVGAYPAVGAGCTLRSPYDSFSQNTFCSAGFPDRGWGLSDGPTWTFSSQVQIIGRPRGVPEYDICPGLWVHEGDVIVFDSESSNVLTGNGTEGAESWRILANVPTAALIGGVLDKDGNWNLFQSEGNPDGFIGGGKQVLVAPATGLVGRALNYAYYWAASDRGPYCPMPEYKLNVAVRATPQSLGTQSVSGTLQLRWENDNESVVIDFAAVGSGDITVQRLRRDDPLLPEGLPAGTVWDILPSDAFSFDGGSAALTFTYDESLLPEGFDEADILVWHWNGQAWEDVTASLDIYGNTVTTLGVNSFSPFVVVPEPATLGLLVFGGIALVSRRRRRQCQ